MGEEAKQEETPVETEKEDEKTKETTEDEVENLPPPSLVLQVDLHCVGCAKKIQKSIMRIRGVEKVMVDMERNEVIIKGVVEAGAVCAKIAKKTKRNAHVLSSLPSTEGDSNSQVLPTEVSGLTTVELNVSMHCTACAAQLKKKIQKMRGVESVVTELSSGKVMVTGTMDSKTLVDYVKRRTKKQAKIIPPPQPIASEKQEGNVGEKVTTNEENERKDAEAEEEDGEKMEEGKKTGEGESKKEEENEGNVKMMIRYNNYLGPFYVTGAVPSSEIFSDENPNACCIS